jgi:hypothetical protein
MRECHFYGSVSLVRSYGVCGTTTNYEERCSEPLYLCQDHWILLDQYRPVFSCPGHQEKSMQYRDHKGWWYRAKRDGEDFAFEFGMEIV